MHRGMCVCLKVEWLILKRVCMAYLLVNGLSSGRKQHFIPDAMIRAIVCIILNTTMTFVRHNLYHNHPKHDMQEVMNLGFNTSNTINPSNAEAAYIQSTRTQRF